MSQAVLLLFTGCCVAHFCCWISIVQYIEGWVTCKVRHRVLNNQKVYAVLTGLRSFKTCQVPMNLIITQAQMRHLTGQPRFIYFLNKA